MKKLLFSLYLLLNALVASAQSLGGYAISDFLVSAVHPNGCNQNYVTGPPDDLTWVNFNDGDMMSGNFGSTWIDAPGNELLLETSYHADNYAVRLKLSTGLYSTIYNVLVANWTQITDTTWIHLFNSCTFGTQGVTRYIMPLDFNLHFGLSPTDIVTGIEITFLATPGAPDLSGVYIISNQPCNLNLGNDTTLCQGDTLVVNATLANSTYLWQNNSTNQAFTVTQAGTYWVTATNNTCTVTDTIVVNYNPLPTVSIGTDSTLCQGETLTLDATTLNATYQWQNNSTNSSLTVSASGTYWVKINVNNCINSDTVIVNFSPLPNVALGIDTALCIGETLILDATTASASYLWHNNASNSSFNVTTPGTYWVTVTINNCSATDSIVVNYNSIPIISLGIDSTLCQGETLTLNATTPNATYLWQNNTTNASFNVSTPGTYWVNINVNNCTATDTVIVNFNPLPSVNLGLDTVLCQGETLTLDATTLNASYQWQNNSTNPSFVVTTSGTYWVKINVNNCTDIDTIIANFNSLPTVDLGIDTALCQGETLTLDATTLNAAYLWQNNSNNPTYNVTMPGTYWATVTVNNCSATDSIIINYNSFPIVSLGVDSTLCTGEILTLDATTLNATYQWQNNSTASSFNVSQQGLHWVKVTVNNCTTIDSINVYYNPSPTVNLGVDTTLCFGSNLLLNATNPNASYQWNDGSSTSTYTVSDSGTYWVKITMNNCTAMDTIHVNFHPFFSIDLGNDTLLCYGEVIILDATTSNATYQWQSNSTNPTYTVTQVGTYWVTVTVNNCSMMDSVSVSFNPLPSINFSNDTIICLGQSLLLNASSFNSSYLWQDNSTNPTFTVTEQGTYWVEVKNKCWTYFDTSIVVVKNCDCTFYVPTAFTPEGNNSNDRFAPVSDCNFTEYHFMIFNRWGEKLFETNSSIESWDGTYKGEIAPIGVYIYSVTYNFEDEVRTNSKGLIHLLR